VFLLVLVVVLQLPQKVRLQEEAWVLDSVTVGSAERLQVKLHRYSQVNPDSLIHHTLF